MKRKIRMIALAALSLSFASNVTLASQLRYYQNLSFDSKVVSAGVTDNNTTKPEQPTTPAPEADPETTTCAYNAGINNWRVNKKSGMSIAVWNGHTVGTSDASDVSLVSGGITYHRNGAALTTTQLYQAYEVCRTTKPSMGQGTWEPIAASVSDWSHVSEDTAKYYDCTYTPMASEMPAGQNFQTSATNCKTATVRTVQNREMNSMTFEVRNAGQPYTENSYEIITGTWITTLVGTKQTVN